MQRVRLLFLLVLTITLTNASPSGVAAGERDGRPAPDFKLPTRKGEVNLSAFRGKVVYVDFWASWCVPCRQSFPWMGSLSERYAPKGLVVIAVNLDIERSAAEAFLKRHPAPFHVAFDPSGKTAEAFHVQAMPTSSVIDRRGRIIHVHEGFQAAKAGVTEDQIKEALSE